TRHKAHSAATSIRAWLSWPIIVFRCVGLMVFPISNFFGPKVREFRRQRIQTRVAASFPMFDEERYLQANPDIARTVEEGGFLSGAQHFLLHGQYEMRDAGQEARRLVIELGDQFFDY